MSEETNIYTYKRSDEGSLKSKERSNPTLATIGSFFRQELGQVTEMRTIVMAVIGFFMGRGLILGELLPFAAAFLAAYAALKLRGSLIVLISISLGLLTIGQGLAATASILNLVAILIFLSFLDFEARQRWIAVPLLVFSITVIVKTTAIAIIDPSFYNYIVVLFEAFLAALLSVVFLVAVNPLGKGSFNLFKSNEEIICGFILITAIIVGLGEMQVGIISIKNVVGRFIILMTGLVGGASLGAVAGTVVGIIPSVGTLIAPTIIGLYAFTGMMAGMFRKFGKLGVGLGFMLGNIILSIYFTTTDNLMATLGETLIAIALLFIFPQKYIEALKKDFKGIIPSIEEGIPQDVDNNTTTEKMQQLSKVFNELSRTFQQITCETEVKEDTGLKIFIEGVTTKLCSKCPKERYCWNDGELYKTYKSFLESFTFLEQEGLIKPNKIDDDLYKKCNRIPELVMALNSTYETFKVNNFWQRRVAESRDIVSDQLKGVAEIMDNLSAELKSNQAGQVTLGKKPLFQVLIGHAKVGKGGSVISGDNYSTLDLQAGKWAVILSDGMGVGPKAAMESKAAISLLKQLMKSGISKDVAVKTVNSVLLLRSTEETFATVDLAVIDLNTAETDFLKIGAAPSFIKRDNKVSLIKSSSLPIGILNNIQMETVKKVLQSGDTLVMVSDGVLDSRQDMMDKEDWLIDFLENLLIEDPQDIADLILWHAKNNSGGRILDDMTVVVVKMEVADAF